MTNPPTSDYDAASSAAYHDCNNRHHSTAGPSIDGSRLCTPGESKHPVRLKLISSEAIRAWGRLEMEQKKDPNTGIVTNTNGIRKQLKDDAYLTPEYEKKFDMPQGYVMINHALFACKMKKDIAEKVALYSSPMTPKGHQTDMVALVVELIRLIREQAGNHILIELLNAAKQTGPNQIHYRGQVIQDFRELKSAFKDELSKDLCKKIYNALWLHFEPDEIWEKIAFKVMTSLCLWYDPNQSNHKTRKKAIIGVLREKLADSFKKTLNKKGRTKHGVTIVQGNKKSKKKGMQHEFDFDVNVKGWYAEAAQKWRESKLNSRNYDGSSENEQRSNKDDTPCSPKATSRTEQARTQKVPSPSQPKHPFSSHADLDDDSSDEETVGNGGKAIHEATNDGWIRDNLLKELETERRQREADRKRADEEEKKKNEQIERLMKELQESQQLIAIEQKKLSVQLKRKEKDQKTAIESLKDVVTMEKQDQANSRYQCTKANAAALKRKAAQLEAPNNKKSKPCLKGKGTSSQSPAANRSKPPQPSCHATVSPMELSLSPKTGNALKLPCDHSDADHYCFEIHDHRVKKNGKVQLFCSHKSASGKYENPPKGWHDMVHIWNDECEAVTQALEEDGQEVPNLVIVYANKVKDNKVYHAVAHLAKDDVLTLFPDYEEEASEDMNESPCCKYDHTGYNIETYDMCPYIVYFQDGGFLYGSKCRDCGNSLVGDQVIKPSANCPIFVCRSLMNQHRNLAICPDGIVCNTCYIKATLNQSNRGSRRRPALKG